MGAERFLRLSRDLFLVAKNGYFTEASEAWTGLLGWPQEELAARPLLQFFHPDDRAKLTAELERVAAGSERHGFECRILERSGTYRWMSWSAAFDRAEGVVLLIGKDIHREKERAEFSRLFFDNAPVGLNLCALDGTWLESNPAFLKTIGYSKEQADGKLTYWQLTPRRYDDLEQLQLQQLREEGRYGPYEKEFVRADGTLVPVRLHGFIIHREGQSFIWSIIEDITQERLLQAEIEAKTALFEAIAENIPTALFVKDVRDDFKFIYWNRAAEEVFHRPRESVIGRTAHELWPKDQADQYRADDEEVVRQARLVDIQEEPSEIPGGATILLHTKKLPLCLSGPEPDLLLCISDDITKRKQLEAELRAAIDVRDEFLSIASHELRTPLTALSLQLQLLDLCVGDPGSRAQAARLAHRSLGACRQITALLNELLDITRIRTGKLTLHRREVDLTAAIHQVLSAMSEEIRRSGSAIHVTAEGPVRGMWDPNRIQQVLANLLSNALKYGGGQPIDVTVRVDRATGRARLSLKDRGIGIPAELQEIIFQRFERGVSSEKISGLGLGLYIVKQVVQAHGGSIRVESAPGEGALFVVELPLEVAPAQGMAQ